MPTWEELAHDSLTAAKSLLKDGNLRSCLSRAYYSAYASATGALIASGNYVGSPDRPNPSHEQIASLLRHNLDRKQFNNRTRTDLSRRLRTLRRFRLIADYEPRETITVQVAIVCVRDAATIVDTLRN